MVNVSTRDLVGQRFGRLVALKRTTKTRNGVNCAAWLMRCDCGVEKVVFEFRLLSGKTSSCGCYIREIRSKGLTLVHGFTAKGNYHPLYAVWRTMIARCHCSTNDSYSGYGARGIAVCDRWRFGENGMHPLECFAADMGAKPSPKHSIDRIDNDKGYEPGNCRWATAKEQVQNTRRSVKAKMIVTLHLQGLTVDEIAHRLGRKHTTIRRALKRIGPSNSADPWRK